MPAQGIEAAEELGHCDFTGYERAHQEGVQGAALALRGDRNRRSQADAPLEQPAQQRSGESIEQQPESIGSDRRQIGTGADECSEDDHRGQDEAAPADAERDQHAQPAAESAQAGDPLDVELFPEHGPLAHGGHFFATAGLL